MRLIYIDESGNSGKNLNDPDQPVFYLGAMVVAEEKWKSLEADLRGVLDARFPAWRTTKDFEIHSYELRGGSGRFKGWRVEDRILFRDAWMSVGVKHDVRLMGRSILKARFSDWLVDRFGHGVSVDPYVAAFPFVCKCLDTYLKNLNPESLGLLICDENKQIVRDVEKSLAVLRGTSGPLKFTQVIEKGFFIDSRKSLPLQLCDLFTMSLRKKAEREEGFTPGKSVDDSGIAIAEKLLHVDRKHEKDVLDWLRSEQEAAQKSGGQGFPQGSTDAGP